MDLLVVCEFKGFEGVERGQEMDFIFIDILMSLNVGFATSIV